MIKGNCETLSLSVSLFIERGSCNCPDSNLNSIRPLCPTRWLCRLKPVQSTVDNYPLLLQAFSKLAVSVELSAEAKSKAQRIFKNLADAETFLGLSLVLKPFALLEQFSLTLQGEKVEFDSAEEAVQKVDELIKKYRDSDFDEHFESAKSLPEKFEDIIVKPLREPRQRRIPIRYGGGSRDASSDLQQHYRIQYFQFVDKITVEIRERFSYNSSDSDLSSYRELAQIFKTGVIPNSVKSYPEIDFVKLSSQVKSFREHTNADSVHSAKKAYQEMDSLERGLFPQVFILLKILLVCPISSTSCERSFSTLRRLKTWLRNRMGQKRLNFNAVCSIHKDLLKQVDIRVILQDFINKNSNRRNKFGSMKS